MVSANVEAGDPRGLLRGGCAIGVGICQIREA